MANDMSKARAARKAPGYSASKRALADKFTRALMNEFQQHGMKALEDVRANHPDVFIRLCASMVPQTLEVLEAEPLSMEQAMVECVRFLVSLPPDEYNQVMSATLAERHGESDDMGITDTTGVTH